MGYLVHRRCLSILGNVSDANDALQDTFIRAIKYPPKAMESKLGWLYGISTRVCFDQLARRIRTQAWPGRLLTQLRELLVTLDRPAAGAQADGGIRVGEARFSHARDGRASSFRRAHPRGDRAADGLLSQMGGDQAEDWRGPPPSASRPGRRRANHSDLNLTLDPVAAPDTPAAPGAGGSSRRPRGPPRWRPIWAECAGCRAYVDTLRGHTARFLAAHPSDRFLVQLSRRDTRPRPAAGSRWWASLTAMALGALITFAFWRDGPGQGARSGLQFKGPLVSTYVQRQGEAVPLRAGDALHPKDALRFVVRAEEPGYRGGLRARPRGTCDGGRALRCHCGANRWGPGAPPFPTRQSWIPRSAPTISWPSSRPQPLALGPLVETLSAGQAIDCNGCRVELLDFDKRP